ncbi:Hcp1 family type VI secretion system effector [Mangrovibacter phragmitis]|uniref:Hcp1 family type VI secretion system effector n=1 Tax=Mangrovibacter phragmitis TaxID=1691903 RepID=A0A1B7KYW5_9ENTR|nr:type VI secretion system tube protein TssD [Mangrovibacter phragmitis]OAT75309.1 Hcp1 family type VI secretion system effector [Mangrovibacter phragmitis]
MPIPGYLWLYDDGGSHIKGSVDVQGREGSIEVVGFSHGLNLPVGPVNGKITGTRNHSPFMIEKEFDASSPYLYKAVSQGQTLKSGELRRYKINDAGHEECYFIMLIEGVKITGVNPGMPNIKYVANSQINHMESVGMQYEKITRHYVDGNVKHTDAWNMR